MVIDLTPTPEGLARSIKLFQEQITKSEKLIADTERWLSLLGGGLHLPPRLVVWQIDFPLLEAAFEALQDQERQRIEHMREGIAAAGGK